MTGDATDGDEVGRLASAIRADLRAHADPLRAPGQQAYMKSAMPFLGVSVPVARRIARTHARHVRPEVLRRTAGVLWDEASQREERYAALALLGLDGLRGDPETVPLIEHMVTTGRWWDITDELAHRVADLLDADPLPAAALVRAWSVDNDLWLRRLAIISQLGRRDDLDRDLLTDVVEQNVDDPEFFIRKAIGWALRDAARAHPDWVREFVATHTLSPLSVREATKHL
ncbi:MAG: DNA alkylation repair protein [Microbacterium sp.]|uniref:DNA alkylation repair protein n=1 Tax=Microbacterium sp. TaxID=51671 RepID=UPI001ACEC749|nr:DNA alkylation repair protein [Microbacterium sp.]MBN9177213.1 DNA alkylation repair protein [Microbacterium sp.]